MDILKNQTEPAKEDLNYPSPFCLPQKLNPPDFWYITIKVSARNLHPVAMEALLYIEEIILWDYTFLNSFAYMMVVER